MEIVRTHTYTRPQALRKSPLRRLIPVISLGLLALLVAALAPPGGAQAADGSPTPATVTKVDITSSPASGDTYGAGETIQVTATFSEAVTVTVAGDLAPFLRMTVGSVIRHADYASGSGSSAIAFEYTVIARDKDTDGVSLPQNPIIKLTAAAIKSTADGTHANPNYPAVSDQASHKVDGSAIPAASPGIGPNVMAMRIASSPASGDTYSMNEKIVIEVSWSAGVYGFYSPEPTLDLTIGSSTVQADFVRHVADKTTFSHRVGSGDMDANGVGIPADPINLSDSSAIRGLDGDKDAALTYAGLTDQAGHKVNGSSDTVGPTITDVRIWSGGGPYDVGDVIAVRVGFSERIFVVGAPTFDVVIGENTRTFTYAPKSHITGAAVFEYTVQAGDSDADGISISANSLSVPSGASIKDKAGNNAVLAHTSLPAQPDHAVSTAGGL